MTKLLTLATAIVFAISSFSATAQAGMRGVGIGIGIGVGLGALGAMSNSGSRRSEAREYTSRKKERAARRERQEKSPSRTAKKSKSEPTQEASKEESAEKTPAFAATSEASGIATKDGAPVSPVTTGSTDLAAQSENSSISLASATTADVSKKIDTASQETRSLDCKKFFPSVGMTLSAPCE